MLNDHGDLLESRSCFASLISDTGKGVVWVVGNNIAGEVVVVAVVVVIVIKIRIVLAVRQCRSPQCWDRLEGLAMAGYAAGLSVKGSSSSSSASSGWRARFSSNIIP